MPDQEIILDLIAKDAYSRQIAEARAAVDQMSESDKKSAVDEANAAAAAQRRAQSLDQESHSASGAKQANLDLGSAIVVANQATQLASEVGKIAGDVYDTLLGSALKYDAQVKDLSLTIGLSTEETSKLLGVSQKFGVSNDVLTNSLEMMTKRGFAPGLEGLAQLSDKMMAIHSPTERASELSEMFGRQWTALMPILEKGGAAIRAAADEAESFGKVIGQDAADAAEKLEIESNTLRERMDGLTTKIGNALVPILNQAAEAFDKIAFGQQELQKVEQAHSEEVLHTAKSYQEYADEIVRSNAVVGNAIDVTDTIGDRLSEEERHAAIAANGWYELGKKVYDVSNVTGLMNELEFKSANAHISLKDALDILDPAQRRVVDDLAKYVMQSTKATESDKDRATALSTITQRAIQYAAADEKLADLQGKLRDIDAKIAAEGPAHIAVIHNKTMSLQEQAVTENKLEQQEAFLRHVQRQSNETVNDYNLKVNEAKLKVKELSDTLGVHTGVVGGATKAELDQKKAIEEQIAALKEQNRQAAAMDGFKALDSALSSGKINAQEYTERTKDWNRVTQTFTDKELEAATKQQTLISALTDTTTSTADLNKMIAANAQYISSTWTPAVSGATENAETNRSKQRDLMLQYGDTTIAVDLQKVSQDVLANATQTVHLPMNDAHIAKMQAEQSAIMATTGGVNGYIDRLNAIPKLIETTVRTNYTSTGSPPGSGPGGNNGGGSGGHGGGHASGVDMIIPPGYNNDDYPLGYGKSGERFIVQTPDQQQALRPVHHYHQTMNIYTTAAPNPTQGFGLMKALAGAM